VLFVVPVSPRVPESGVFASLGERAHPGLGALIGAAAGGATGVLTTPSQGSISKPVYKSSTGGGGGMVRDIQAGLQRLGYDPGAADGRMGPRTSAAIRKYQQDNGMTVDGQPSQAVLDSIRSKS